MSRPSRDLELKVKGYIASLDMITFFRRRREFLFSFALSDSFRALHYFSRLRLVDAYLLLIGIAGVLFVSPDAFIVCGIAAMLGYPYFHFVKLRNPEESMSWDELISVLRIFLAFVLLLGLIATNKELTPLEALSSKGLLYFIEDNHVLWTWIVVSISPLLLPWYKVWYWMDKFHHRVMDLKARGWKRVIAGAANVMRKQGAAFARFVTMLLALGGLWVVLLVLLVLCTGPDGRPSDQCAIIFLVLLLVLSPVYGIMAYRGVLSWRNNKRLYHDMVTKESVSREDIEKSLNRLTSPRLRTKLLEHLDRKRILRKGDWPEDWPITLRMTISRLLSDWREYRRIPVNGTMSREQIAETISKLRTNKYRSRFVEDLERQQTVPGAWPTDDLFNTTNDPTITLLARLEERWLELDR